VKHQLPMRRMWDWRDSLPAREVSEEQARVVKRGCLDHPELKVDPVQDLRMGGARHRDLQLVGEVVSPAVDFADVAICELSLMSSHCADQCSPKSLRGRQVAGGLSGCERIWLTSWVTLGMKLWSAPLLTASEESRPVTMQCARQV